MKEIKNFIKDKNNLESLKELGFDTNTIWYHVTNNMFSEFDTNKFFDQNIWLTRDLKTIENGETGASLNSGEANIMKCFIKSDLNLCGWDEQDLLMDDQLMQKGYHGALLDDDVKLFNSKNVVILDNNIEQKIKTLKNQQKTKINSNKKS